MPVPEVNPRRELAMAALLCLAGAGLTVAAGGRPWATVHARNAIVAVSVPVTGLDLTTAATALGWAGLAGAAALFAVRGAVRAGLGALLAIFGAAIAYASATAVGHAHVASVAAGKSQLLTLGQVYIATTGWWPVSLTGGLLLLAAGAVTTVRGPRWPGMSQRYDRAQAPGPAPSRSRAAAAAGTEPDSAGMWKALDRGEDPTGG